MSSNSIILNQPMNRDIEMVEINPIEQLLPIEIVPQFQTIPLEKLLMCLKSHMTQKTWPPGPQTGIVFRATLSGLYVESTNLYQCICGEYSSDCQQNCCSHLKKFSSTIGVTDNGNLSQKMLVACGGFVKHLNKRQLVFLKPKTFCRPNHFTNNLVIII